MKIGNLTKSHKSTDIATYIRGVAAASVVMVHWNGLGLRDIYSNNSRLDAMFENIIDLGALGPIVFFIASGFSLAASLSSNNYKFSQYATRRFFRLSPMLTFSILLVVISRVNQIDSTAFKDLFSKIFFIDVFSPVQYYKDPIGVLWSVPIEFWWSLSIPTLVAVLKLRNFIYLIIPIFFLAFLGVRGDSVWAHVPYAREFNQHFIINSGIYFVLGVLSYKLRVSSGLRRNFNAALTLFLIFGLLLCLFEFKSYYIVISLTLAYLTFWQQISEKNYKRKTLLFLGNICYSIYLLHLPVQEFSLLFIGHIWIEPVIRLFLLIIFSTATFLFIEMPFIKLGEYVYGKISKKIKKL